MDVKRNNVQGNAEKHCKIVIKLFPGMLQPMKLIIYLLPRMTITMIVCPMMRSLTTMILLWAAKPQTMEIICRIFIISAMNCKLLQTLSWFSTYWAIYLPKSNIYLGIIPILFIQSFFNSKTPWVFSMTNILISIIYCLPSDFNYLVSNFSPLLSYISVVQIKIQLKVINTIYLTLVRVRNLGFISLLFSARRYFSRSSITYSRSVWCFSAISSALSQLCIRMHIRMASRIFLLCTRQISASVWRPLRIEFSAICSTLDPGRFCNWFLSKIISIDFLLLPSNFNKNMNFMICLVINLFVFLIGKLKFSTVSIYDG